jgi:hypothetical protein
MASPRARRALAPVALALISTAICVVALEVGLRIRRGAGLAADPDPTRAVRMLGAMYPTRYDPELGYAPAPGVHEVSGARATIDARGLRENGNPPPPPGPSILALGDSFTFGDEVDDRSTWPAALERRLGRRVWNAGVFGYGLDQVALRAERLSAELAPAALVVKIIPDDVTRCEYAYRFAHKPWFELDDGGLALRGVPVPRPEEPAPGDSAWRRSLSHSFLADFTLRRLDPLGWPLRGMVRVQRDGPAVAAALVERLADTSARQSQRLLLVMGWHPGAQLELLEPLRQRARALGLEVVELEPVLVREIEANGGDWTRLFHAAVAFGGVPGHMTPQGNERVAAVIAERLRDL